MLSALPASAANVKAIAPDVVGAWRLTFTTPDGVQRTPTVVVGRQRDELVAWYIDKGEPEAFKEVCVADDALVLTIVPRERGGKTTVKLVAKPNGDDRCCGKGEYQLTDGESGSWEFSGERLDPTELDHVAQWNLSFTTPDGEKHEPTVHVFEKGDTLYGWYISDDYELLTKSLKIDGDRVSLAIAAKVSGGSNADVTFRGTIDGDSVRGKADYALDDERGSFPFTGREQLN
jgi:hypothetical protein